MERINCVSKMLSDLISWFGDNWVVMFKLVQLLTSNSIKSPDWNQHNTWIHVSSKSRINTTVNTFS